MTTRMIEIACASVKGVVGVAADSDSYNSFDVFISYSAAGTFDAVKAKVRKLIADEDLKPIETGKYAILMLDSDSMIRGSITYYPVEV